MKKYILLIPLIINFLFNHFLYAQDTLVVKKKNIVYIIPTSILGNMLEVNAVSLLIGYDYRLNKKQFMGVSIGAN